MSFKVLNWLNISLTAHIFLFFQRTIIKREKIVWVNLFLLLLFLFSFYGSIVNLFLFVLLFHTLLYLAWWM